MYLSKASNVQVHQVGGIQGRDNVEGDDDEDVDDV